MNIDSIFGFGKNKGRTVREVWSGINDFDEEEIIKIYLIELFGFLFKKENKYFIPRPIFEDIYLFLSPDEIEKHDLSKCDITVTKNYIIIDKADHEMLEVVTTIMATILKGDYSELNNRNYFATDDVDSNIGYSDNSYKFLSLKANPSYIGWCIINVAKFSIDPDDFDVLLKLESRSLATFEVTKLKENLIQYKPMFNIHQSNFTKKCIELNKQKFNQRPTRSYSDNSDDYDNYYSEDADGDRYCPACQESPCRCSDPF